MPAITCCEYSTVSQHAGLSVLTLLGFLAREGMISPLLGVRCDWGGGSKAIPFIAGRGETLIQNPLTKLLMPHTCLIPHTLVPITYISRTERSDATNTGCQLYPAAFILVRRTVLEANAFSEPGGCCGDVLHPKGRVCRGGDYAVRIFPQVSS